jgi:hypothetical protein
MMFLIVLPMVTPFRADSSKNCGAGTGPEDKIREFQFQFGRLTYVRHLSYTHFMPINYMQMLLDLMEERQKWLNQRDEAVREISRLSELIRATMNMIPAEQIARYEPIFERIEQRPVGLSLAIRACFTAGAAGLAGYAGKEAPVKIKEWFTPIEIRDALKRMGFPFDNYKANPLASIHTTLKRMVPAEVEVKTQPDGQKTYRLKGAGEWAQAFAEVRQWLRGSFDVVESAGSVVAMQRKDKNKEQKQSSEAATAPAEGAKRGTSGGA